MKIAMCVYDFPKISETFILNQITGLLDSGHDVTIFAFAPGDNDTTKIHADITRYNLLARTYYRPWESQHRWAQTHDIIHCQFGPLGMVGAELRARGFLSGKLITTFRGYDFSQYPQENGSHVYQALFAVGDWFTAHTPYSIDKVISLGCPPNRISALPSGLDVAQFIPRKMKEDNGTINVLTVARLVEKKGVEYTIRAVAQVLRDYPHLNLVYRIAGDGYLREPLMALIAELGIQKNVQLLGWQTQEEVRELYRQADIFVLSSVTAQDGDQEGLPMALREAQAMQVPVVSTLHSGIPDGVLDKVSGFLVEERDVDALADRMAYLVNNPQARHEMGVAGRRFVESKYDMSILSKRLIDLYEDVLACKENERQRDDVISSAKAVLAQENWLADVAVYPAGARQVLVQAKSTGATRLLHRKYAELLLQCREFKTLDEHLATFCTGPLTSIEVVQGLRSKLQQLAGEGYLIPRSQMHRLFKEADTQVQPTRITTIGIPTCSQFETAQSCLTSYVENCQHFGRSPDFVVMDDSPSPTTREAYREMLRSLKKRYGMSIAYAGLEEKTAYVRKLSEVGKIPEEIVSWTCLGDRTYGVRTTGANRNALLLHTVGECIFLSDDDLICRVAASPELKKGLAVCSQERFVQYRFFQGRENALEAVQPVEQDLLALHEQWLGQDPLVSGALYSHVGQLSVEQAGPDFLRRLATQSGKVASTAHGIIGASRFITTMDFLFHLPFESLKRLLSSEQAYHFARTSRETAQAVDQITLTANHPLIGMYIGGLDNRELLPPQAPVGRSQDVVFSRILNKCFPDAYAIYLPWVVLHTPPGARSYSEPDFGVPFHEWLPECIARFHPAQADTPTNRLYQLGHFLEQIGSLPPPAFEEFASQTLWQREGACISFLENQLHTKEGLLASYRQDIEAYCTKIRQGMLLPVRQRMVGGAEILQRSLLQFAEILQWWPAMVETARCLRADGFRLAQPM